MNPRPEGVSPICPTPIIIPRSAPSRLKHTRLLLIASTVALIIVGISSNIIFQVSAQTVTSTTFKLPSGTPWTCGYFWASFELVGGQKVAIRWSTLSSIPMAIDWYIASPAADSGRWFCDSGPEASLSGSGAFGSIHWSTPATGTYSIILVNYGAYPISGGLSLVLGNTTLRPSMSGYGYARELICPIFVLQC